MIRVCAVATNVIEKSAQALNQILRERGKKYGKAWRQRVRALLGQTFAALNAKPLDGALCLRLQGQIEAELNAIQNDAVDTTTLPDVPESAAKPGNKAAAEDASYKAAARMDAGHSAAGARIGKANSDQGEPPMARKSASCDDLGDHRGAGDVPPVQKKSPDDGIGLFDLIRVQVRTFFTIRACVRPPYIGKFVTFADRYAEIVQERIDTFLNVLSKGDDALKTKVDVDVGYREDLLPDMPDRNLVLAPKKKKRR